MVTSYQNLVSNGDHPKPKALVLVGPTGVGKTDLSLAIAEKISVEIVSADSRQVYRYMDIGTSKPSRRQRRRVVHHLIDVVDPDQKYNAGMYGRQAREAVRGILERNRIPLIVGGSGLYIGALLDGFFEEQIGGDEVRQVLKERIAKEGSPSLFEELKQVDPAAAERLHPNDAQRIVRALEVFLVTGRCLSEWQRALSQPCEFEPLMLGLSLPRAQLYQRIENRVERMIEAGLIREVQELIARGYTSDLNALQTVGYQEAFSFLEGKQTLAETIEMIKRNTRRYAKRQMTWFRRDSRIRWLKWDPKRIQELADHCINLLNGRA